MQEADIAIIGGGIAGASAAFELAAAASVVLIERESQCGYHSTGRSAASFTENYGTALIRRLAIASRGFLEAPPEGFCDHPLMQPRGMLTIAREDQLDLLAEELERARAFVPSIHRVTTGDALARVPVLRPDYVAGAIVEPDSREIDVNELHQGFLRGARKRGARIVTNAGIDAIARHGDRWHLQTSHGVFAAPIVVNAAGAWADTIAALAGVAPVGLVPKRRTAFHVAAPDGVAIAGWPLVNDVGEEFYFKPDAGQIFVSPSDATPSEPMDAYPDDLDVAIGVDRLQQRHDDRGAPDRASMGGPAQLCQRRLARRRLRRRRRRLLLAGRPGRLRHQDIAGAGQGMPRTDPSADGCRMICCARASNRAILRPAASGRLLNRSKTTG